MQSIGLAALYSYRGLLLAWTGRTVRARYQQSVLGGLWAVLQPASVVVVFAVVFTLFIPVDTGDVPYVLFSYTAMVPWTFFASSLTDMVDSLVANMALVSKIYFPRETMPVSAMLARLVDFGIAGGLLVVLMVYYRAPIFTPSLVYLPLVLIIQLALTLGLGLVGAALNVFYRDVKHLFALGLQLWFYATPIVYPASLVPENLRPYYFINPMAGIIEAYRAILLYQRVPGSYLLLSMVVALVALLIGYWLFKLLEAQFADVV
jgi:lipopolysaccharide transport system permease protein